MSFLPGDSGAPVIAESYRLAGEPYFSYSRNGRELVTLSRFGVCITHGDRAMKSDEAMDLTMCLMAMYRDSDVQHVLWDAQSNRRAAC